MTIQIRPGFFTVIMEPSCLPGITLLLAPDRPDPGYVLEEPSSVFHHFWVKDLRNARFPILFWGVPIIFQLLFVFLRSHFGCCHTCFMSYGLLKHLVISSKNRRVRAFFNDTATTEIYTNHIFPYTTLFRSGSPPKSGEIPPMVFQEHIQD